MKPWEKRLGDLSRLLQNCHATYLDPDLFCMNTNQFLQTARTVTFIIQKNKSSIPDFENWYAQAVLDPWGKDEVMNWAKEARNKIEKEGDLDLNSSLKLTLVFSYLSEEDVEVQCSKAELLNARIKQLVRLAQKSLPSGVSDAAAVMIERCWVTASLPHWELLEAMGYVYARVFECCQALANQLGTKMDECIPDRGSFSALLGQTRQVRYVKLNGLNMHSQRTNVIARDPNYRPPEAILAAFNEIHSNQSWPTNLEKVLEYYTKMAELTFNQFGSHVPMLFLLGEDWKPIDMITTQFSDQTDKYIFWRNIAQRITTLKAAGLVWISESWLRRHDKSGATAIRNMPITGERLNVVVIDRHDNCFQVGWEIVRPSDDTKPTLRRADDMDSTEKGMMPFYLVPALRAMGIKEPQFLTKVNVG